MNDFLVKIRSFLKAVFGKKTSMESYVKRLNTCLFCSWNVTKDERHYCRECGCPETKLWPFSELKRKCNYLYAECPRKKWEDPKTL